MRTWEQVQHITYIIIWLQNYSTRQCDKLKLQHHSTSTTTHYTVYLCNIWNKYPECIPFVTTHHSNTAVVLHCVRDWLTGLTKLTLAIKDTTKTMPRWTTNDGSLVFQQVISYLQHKDDDAVTMQLHQLQKSFSVGSLLFSSGQTAVRLSGAEAANWAQCAAPVQLGHFMTTIMSTMILKQLLAHQLSL